MIKSHILHLFEKLDFGEDFKDFMRPSKSKRLLFFFLSDVILFVLSFLAALSIVLDLSPQVLNQISRNFSYLLPLFVLLKISFLYLFKSYQVNWRFISIKDLVNIILALTCASLLLFIASLTTKGLLPYSFLFVDYLSSVCLVSLHRISKRVYLEFLSKRVHHSEKDPQRVLIIGAGNSGESIVRSILRNGVEMQVVGFLDDDPNKLGTYIHGIPVLGDLTFLPKALKYYAIDTIIIAITKMHYKEVQKIYDISLKYGVKNVKIVPSLSHLPSTSITVKDLRDLNIEDLLARKPVTVDEKKIHNFISGKTIMVTGAAGSIGSETVRQLLKFSPKVIVAYEIDETELHNLTLEIEYLKRKMHVETKFVPIVGNIKDIQKVADVLKTYRVDMIFHAAAYKHVPLMEFFPEEAIKINTLGTYSLARLAIKYNVKKFINISTDKAVNPTSIMGASKRMAEMICTSLNSLGKTQFISVRFGNVLGSRGSVIPIFLEQIKKGGPITITHPEMKRYFMTIPEAVLLIFQAAVLGKGGEVFVLDMGEPVKIVDLAKRLVRMHGLEPGKDIDIVYIGLRPGEKLFEELLTAEEGTQATSHNKIFVAKISTNYSFQEIKEILGKLKLVLQKQDKEQIKLFLKKYIPFYKESDEDLQNKQKAA